MITLIETPHEEFACTTGTGVGYCEAEATHVPDTDDWDGAAYCESCVKKLIEDGKAVIKS